MSDEFRLDSQGRRRVESVPTKAADRRFWIPDLSYDHPGYFKVVVSLIFVHVGLALDSVLKGPANSPVFKVLNEALDGQLWLLAAAHVVTTVLIVFGLYARKHFAIMRFGCGLSLITFNIVAACFAAASFQQNLSYYSAIASVTLSLSSLAAMKEPQYQRDTR